MGRGWGAWPIVLFLSLPPLLAIPLGEILDPLTVEYLLQHASAVGDLTASKPYRAPASVLFPLYVLSSPFVLYWLTRNSNPSPIGMAQAACLAGGSLVLSIGLMAAVVFGSFDGHSSFSRRGGAVVQLMGENYPALALFLGVLVGVATVFAYVPFAIIRSWLANR